MIIGFSGFARAGKNTAAEEFAKISLNRRMENEKVF